VASRIYTDRVTVGGIDISSATSNPNGVLEGRKGSIIVSEDPLSPGVYQNMDGVKDWELLVPRREIIMGIAKQILVGSGELPSEVVAGLIPSIFQDESSLPAVPPVVPGYAVVWPAGSSQWDIAWFIHGVWQLSTFPWIRPGIPLPSGALPVFTLAGAVGSGQSAWQLAIGNVFKSTPAAVGQNIIGIALKLGSGSQNTTHAFAVRGGGVSASRPAPAAFGGTPLKSGVLTTPDPDNWMFEEFASPIPITAADQWFYAQTWIGQGGQYAIVNTLRSQGLTNETFLEWDSAMYVSAPGTNPGTTPDPTISLANGRAYGMPVLVTDGGPS